MKQTIQQPDESKTVQKKDLVDIEGPTRGGCCKQRVYPPPPPNADVINPNIPSTDDICRPITFNFINPLVKKIQKQGTLYICDCPSISKKNSTLEGGKQMKKFWNEEVQNRKKQQEHIKEGKQKHMKPMKSVISMIFEASRSSTLWLILLVPLTSLCSLAMPLALQQFTKDLTPSALYDCDAIFTNGNVANQLSYGRGVGKLFEGLWGYLVMILLSTLLQVWFQNIGYYVLMQAAIKGCNGLLDLIAHKLLTISEASKDISANGNVTNLLYSDSQKITMLLVMLNMIIQIPIDLVIYIVYIPIALNPWSLIGIAAAFVVFPLIAILMGKVIYIQKQIMSMRDLRLKRAGEILNGIKVIKMFNQEDVQEARLKHTRDLEIRSLLGLTVCMSVFGTIASACAPIMTTVAFGVLEGVGEFETSTAFTTMFVFQYLSFSVIMLPMLLTMISDASLSGRRMQTFIMLPDRDKTFTVYSHLLTQKQADDFNKVVPEDTAVLVTGKPSFCWSNAQDRKMPPILDPFYKQNRQYAATAKKILPKVSKQVQQEISKLNQEDKQVIENMQKLDKIEKYHVLDQWALEVDCQLPSHILNIQQYNSIHYEKNKKDTPLQAVKRLILHEDVLKFIIQSFEQNQDDGDVEVLHELEFNAKKGELIGVIGQVGAGKTAFMNSLLGEMRLYTGKREIAEDLEMQEIDYDEDVQFYPDSINLSPEEKHVYLNGDVAYFPQQAQIFNRTVKENIVFGKKYDEQKYNNIVKMCCLLDDFKIMPQGDQTIVGGKGVTLSGGQKARVCLARAVYSDADIILIDDCLSAVDSHVGKALWEQCILGYLKAQGKTVIIGSHQTQYFNDCDRLVHIVDGKIVKFDTVQKFVEDKENIIGLTGEMSEARKNLNKQIAEGSTTELMNLQKAKNETKEVRNTMSTEQVSDRGDVKCKTYLKWASAGSLSIIIFTAITFIIMTAVQQYQSIEITHWSSDYYGWTQADYGAQGMNITVNDYGNLGQYGITTEQDVMQFIGNVTMANQSAQTSPYMVAVQCLQEQGASLSMSQSTSIRYLCLYIGLTVAMIILSFLANLLFGVFCLSISKKLHNQMLHSILRTAMAFFDTTPQGRILNRFSKDTDSLDSNVLRFAQSVISTALNVIGMIISIACVNWPALIVIIPAIIIFLLIFIQFSSIYPQMKRLEAITRSPVYNLCGEITDGLTCIRAFNQEQLFIREFRQAVDFNAGIMINSFSMTKWLSFRLGLLTSAFATLVTVACMLVAPADEGVANYTGVIVSYGFSITFILVQFVLTMVNLSGEMASTERLIEYGKLPPEGEFKTEQSIKEKLPENWPSTNTSIEVKHLNFRYRPDLPLVLKDVNFKFEPKEHIGVVGRTGAGKSSLTVCFYRLAKLDPGSEIIVDGQNVLDLGLDDQRKAFTIIPQDPFLFSGTLRQCIDPYAQAEAEGVSTKGLQRYTDEQIWNVLEQVQMKDYFMKQPGGLEAKIALNGDNLSAGQKQLVCVARALLRKAPCVILDEATASVDRENDHLIQEVIRNAFRDVTVFSIAHRLDTIIDFDRVIVMNLGQVVEFDTPANLLRKKGYFYDLVHRTGEENAQRLEKAAFLAEEQRLQGKQVQVDIE